MHLADTRVVAAGALRKGIPVTKLDNSTMPGEQPKVHNSATKHPTGEHFDGGRRFLTHRSRHDVPQDLGDTKLRQDAVWIPGIHIECDLGADVAD